MLQGVAAQTAGAAPRARRGSRPQSLTARSVPGTPNRACFPHSLGAVSVGVVFINQLTDWFNLAHRSSTSRSCARLHPSSMTPPQWCRARTCGRLLLTRLTRPTFMRAWAPRQTASASWPQRNRACSRGTSSQGAIQANTSSSSDSLPHKAARLRAADELSSCVFLTKTPSPSPPRATASPSTPTAGLCAATSACGARCPCMASHFRNAGREPRGHPLLLQTLAPATWATFSPLRSPSFEVSRMRVVCDVSPNPTPHRDSSSAPESSALPAASLSEFAAAPA